MRYCYQTWQIHILLENEMLKNVNFIKIGPRLDMPIGRQSFATNTPTVSALFEPRGSIFQNGFLSGVLLIFDLPGVVIETGVY